METTTAPLPAETSTTRERHALIARLQTSEIFREYQRAFESITSLPLVLRAAGAFQLALQGAGRANSFCTLMSARNKSCAACLEVQQRLEAAACQKAGTVECISGLHESAVPVRVGTTVVAYLHTGQILYHAPSPVRLRKLTRDLNEQDGDANVAALVAAYRTSRVVSKTQYEAILRLLSIFADQLASLANQLMVRETLAEPPAIGRARAFIAEHLTEDLSLAQVSRAVGMSSFYFCKNFKKSTGLTYTEYLSRVRVETVKQLLLNPYKRVSEAAYEAGFQSLSQFNRVFHRIAGEPPSAYRDRLHGGTPRPASHPVRQAAA